MEKFCNSFVISIIVVAIAGADYCDEKLCSTGQHIACRHNGVSQLVIILITTITKEKIDKIISYMCGGCVYCFLFIIFPFYLHYYVHTSVSLQNT